MARISGANATLPLRRARGQRPQLRLFKKTGCRALRGSFFALAHQKQGERVPCFRLPLRFLPLPPVGQRVKAKPLRGASQP